MIAPSDNAVKVPLNDAHQAATLVELLRYRALTQPEKLAYTFLQNGEQPAGQLTYRELDRQARAGTPWLGGQGGYRQRAILIYKAGLDFLVAFMGCLYAGVEAIPLVPPHLSLTHPSREM